MTDNETLAQDNATDAATLEQGNQAEVSESKTYTQKEVDDMMARMRGSIERKVLKPYEELGDPNELRALREAEEKRQRDEQIKRGEFEKTLQELAAKKDDEIRKRDVVITEYKVNSPLLDAAAKHRAVAPEQVRALLGSSVRLGESGEVEVLDTSGNVRYDDSGKPVAVDVLVKEFLDSNPHFVQPGASTTNTRSQVSPTSASSKFSLDSLDLTNAEHRKMYKEAREKGLL